MPEYQQAELIRHLEEQQLRLSLLMVNKLTDTCFDKCVATGWGGSIGSKTLETAESACVTQCAEKYMKVTQRCGARLTEHMQQQGV